MTGKPQHTIIIGAGLSGLAAAAELKAHGVPVSILDGSSRIAETWRRRHPQLRLNTHHALSGLPGRKMSASHGAFPVRDAVVRYLEDYARSLDVPIEHGVTMDRLCPDGCTWRLETDRGTRSARHVIVATGHNRQPVIPDWPGLGRYAGRVIHSADFGELGQYAGKAILVVGAGNSGVDVLNHLATVSTGPVWVSVRHGPTIFPTRFLGVPVQRLAPVMEALPAGVVDTMLACTERLAFGRLRRFGLTRHPAGAATRLLTEGIAPAIDNGFVKALKAGRFSVVPEITGFEDRFARFADGSTADPDVVICATGYRTGLETMLGGLGVVDDRGVPYVGDGEADPRHPGLWFIGMRPPLSGMFRAASKASRRIAEAIDREARTAPEQGHPQSRLTVLANG